MNSLSDLGLVGKKSEQNVITILKPEVEYYTKLQLYEEGCFLRNRPIDKLLTVEEMAGTAVT